MAPMFSRPILPSNEAAAVDATGRPALAPREEYLSYQDGNMSAFTRDILHRRLAGVYGVAEFFQKTLKDEWRNGLNQHPVVLEHFAEMTMAVPQSLLEIVTSPGLVDKLIDDEYKRPEKLRNESDIQYGVRLKEWSIQRMKRLEHARGLYQYIILHLQEDSAAKIAATPQWTTISATFNPIALWLLIEETTHIGGESNLANKAKLRDLKATSFASYEEYTTAVLFLIREIMLGRGVVDQQEISYYVLQGTKALLGESHPEITKYNVAANTGTLPDYNHLLRDFGQFIRATPHLYRSLPKSNPAPSQQETSSNDPNVALVVTHKSPESKWCDIHRAKSHNTAECKLLPAIWEHFKLRDQSKRTQKGDHADAFAVTLGDVLDDLNGFGEEYENLALDLSDTA